MTEEQRFDQFSEYMADAVSSCAFELAKALAVQEASYPPQIDDMALLESIIMHAKHELTDKGIWYCHPFYQTGQDKVRLPCYKTGQCPVPVDICPFRRSLEGPSARLSSELYEES